MKMRKFARVLLWTAFAVYSAAVFGILFLGNRGSRFPYDSVWEYMKYSVQLIPFNTIFGYVEEVIAHRWMLGLAIRNVLGNFILFYPMGIFLPCLFRSVRTVKKSLLISLCTILSVEIVQLVFRLGIFDIDDLILNMAGWILGFLTLSIPMIRKYMKKTYFLEE
jgi:glycopeptide antibiotics resistance protein